MGLKSKILLFPTLLLVFLSVVSTYYKTLHEHNYMLLVEVPCDPVLESCYFYKDDQAGEDIFYKTVEKPAYSYPDCNPSDENCLESIVCTENEASCSVNTCDSMSENDMCASSNSV